MMAFCLVTLVTLLWKYSLQEAKMEQCALKLLFSTTTVTSHKMSRCLCSFRHWRTWELCTADWKVNTDMRGACSDMVPTVQTQPAWQRRWGEEGEWIIWLQKSVCQNRCVTLSTSKICQKMVNYNRHGFIVLLWLNGPKLKYIVYHHTRLKKLENMNIYAI